MAKDLGDERFNELVNSGRGKMPHSDEPPILRSKISRCTSRSKSENDAPHL